MRLRYIPWIATSYIWELTSEPASCRPNVRPPPVASDEDLRRVAELLSRARRPVLLAGGGVNNEEGAKLLLQLAERWQAPVAVTGNGRGSFPEDHPLFLAASSRRAGGVGLRRPDLAYWDSGFNNISRQCAALLSAATRPPRQEGDYAYRG